MALGGTLFTSSDTHQPVVIQSRLLLKMQTPFHSQIKLIIWNTYGCFWYWIVINDPKSNKILWNKIKIGHQNNAKTNWSQNAWCKRMSPTAPNSVNGSVPHSKAPLLLIRKLSRYDCCWISEISLLYVGCGVHVPLVVTLYLMFKYDLKYPIHKLLMVILQLKSV